ncbi:MAG: glutamine-hydrolyzing carbamoyl-phosphate synthase small subunit [Pseudomonadota bacterium]
MTAPKPRFTRTASAASHGRATGVLVLADGSVWFGRGLGAEGSAGGEVCFNTAMTGYQEILTDPSYAGQIITFTFPHIGNVGANDEDAEAKSPQARGLIVKADLTAPANYRAAYAFDSWLRDVGLVGLAGIDTRALTGLIRRRGMPNGLIAHNGGGDFDLDALRREAAALPSLEGMDLAKSVTAEAQTDWHGGLWQWNAGHRAEPLPDKAPHIVAIDFGAKENILRHLEAQGLAVSVVPATASFDEVMAHAPDGIFLSNGPGDPAATETYAGKTLRPLVEADLPVFGICLGHQLLALALGAQTRKMPQGHHGANHPVKDVRSGQVSITSMNHGFTVDTGSLPAGVEETHVSLFDGTNCGLAAHGGRVFSVQFHPEASPGPHDAHGLFAQFAEATRRSQAERSDTSSGQPAAGGPPSVGNT